MRTKPIVTLWVCQVLLLLLPGGCGHQSEKPAADATPEEAVVTFSAKSGLFVPPETAEFIGLKVADVEERQMASALEFTAQVYRTAPEAQFASVQSVASPEAHASGLVSALQAESLREGQAVTVKAEGLDTVPARIEAVTRGVSQSDAPVEVLVVIADSPARLSQGAFVSVIVPLNGEKSVATVPRAALLRTAEGDFVYTVSGERFVRAPVKVGALNHEWAEVADGLYAGDQIVVNAVMALWMAELQSLRGGKACADGH